MIELLNPWTLGQKIEEKHFTGTFIFPNDLDFIGETTNCQFFCDIFNDMINKRINILQSGKTLPESK